MCARVLLASIFICLLGCTWAQAVEVFRNSEPFQITFNLPPGVVLTNQGIDRVFSSGQVQGNLRLIQDTYSDCTDLVNERQGNQAKNGFTRVQDRKTSLAECSITLVNDDQDEIASSFYVWIDACQCYSALQFYYSAASRAEFRDIAGPIVASLESNSNIASSDARADANDPLYLSCSERRARGEVAGENEYNDCNLPQEQQTTQNQYLSCDERRARGETVGENEYNECNLPVRDATTDDQYLTCDERRARGEVVGDNEYNMCNLPTQSEVNAEHEAERQQEADAEEAVREADAKRHQLVAEVRSFDRFKVELSFYSQTSNRAWPGGDQVYILADQQSHSFSLACSPGEKICWGAWRSGSPGTYWGAGYNGRQGCSNCCFICGSENQFSLNDAGPPSADNGDGENLLGDILNGAAIGLGIANAINNASPPSSPPQLMPYRPSTERQSGISGTADH